ncbi:uncharacterized protein SAPINGB_P006182 [Magnusiomyces paraingens]|uniref:Uncharacterized protein n=1 Tax=Magnusiomyces paraingens TaxID=2606893 RepID=A0A5E8C5M8_9ASCO|nr:uncharacterized protein SAPINGB_P006182 [Saprochaete ingens]VVT58390.1 unnamed protein product [Saprochaete ingens]
MASPNYLLPPKDYQGRSRSTDHVTSNTFSKKLPTHRHNYVTATKMRLRLRLALYKIKTKQTRLPLADLAHTNTESSISPVPTLFSPASNVSSSSFTSMDFQYSSLSSSFSSSSSSSRFMYSPSHAYSSSSIPQNIPLGPPQFHLQTIPKHHNVPVYHIQQYPYYNYNQIPASVPTLIYQDHSPFQQQQNHYFFQQGLAPAPRLHTGPIVKLGPSSANISTPLVFRNHTQDSIRLTLR